jgi:penicillin amidase
MRRAIIVVATCALLSMRTDARGPQADRPSKLPGLTAAAEVSRDNFGIAHIRADNEYDLYFLQGYVHAQDRLFQMDVSRRRASGTLAELLGPSELAADVELRTIGIRRAAARSLARISAASRVAIQAYASGVNAYVAGLDRLPPEYQALEITTFQAWTEMDTMTVAKSITFGLSFGLDDIQNTIALQTYTAVFGPETGSVLFSQDLWRSQPFDRASTVPDASMASAPTPRRHAPPGAETDQGPAAALGRQYLHRIGALPFFKHRLNRDNRPGSNEWAVSGQHTASGLPMVANDPHLDLDQPSTFYPIHLTAGAVDVMGSGFAGVPFVVVGQTRDIAWGATVSPLDVTDVYQEQVVSDPESPSGLSTVYMGVKEWVIPIPQTYYFNLIGDGVPDNVGSPAPGTIPPVLIVPRRNNGPIVQFDGDAGTAISVQYTGFSGTRELDTFRIWNRARNLDDFERGLQWFDSGTQNFAYADVRGNIAYYAASEVPIREDLQAGGVAGLPPWFIRNGSGGNEWLPMRHSQPGQAIPYEILPASEMPHLLNPRAGWFVNANNDPAGTVRDNNPLNQRRENGGLYYLNADYDTGFRAGRITELIKSRLRRNGTISFEDMQAIQADVVLPDALYFVPFITQAFARAAVAPQHSLLASLGHNPGVRDAVARLSKWKLSAPTGIAEGYDAADVNGGLETPTRQEIAESIAATIYSVWRGQFIRNTIDATLDAVPLPPGVTLPRPGGQQSLAALKTLLERPQPGVGASGINFFNALSASAGDRRDIVLLESLADALSRLAGPEFVPAFGGSTNQNDYRWGRLHRIVFEHPLGGLFPFLNVPSANGAIPNPLGDDLPGFPTDGGVGVVDASDHNARAQSPNDFMFNFGPANRFVAEAGAAGVRAESVWPGGTSGIPGAPFYVNQLPAYLTNDTVPLLFRHGDLQRELSSVRRFVPAR